MTLMLLTHIQVCLTCALFVLLHRQKDQLIFQNYPSMKLNSTQFSFLLALLITSSTLIGQVAPPLDIANQYVRSNLDLWGLTTGDVQDLSVSSMYTDEKTGISRVYFNQQYKGIPVYNAILNVNINKNGAVFFAGNRFVDRLSEKVNTTIPIISAAQAVDKLATHLGLPYDEVRLVKQTGNRFVFEKGNMATEDIQVQLSYQVVDKTVRLAWNVTIFPVKSSDMWDSRVDAVTGKVLNETNWTVSCQVDGRSFSRTGHDQCSSHNHSFEKTNNTAATSMLAGASYNVWPIPTESPIHGPRELVKDPHDLVASPFGWHDTNGVDGPEYTITRGNNVHAYQDTGGINASSGDEPDGGDDLIFDFPFDALQEPSEYLDAAVVNLFYMNNIMHDFAYHYGMDEAAGNFQFSNYTGQGLGGDYVNADAQDGSGTNNANFSTPPDGNNPRMQMFRWSIGGSNFKVEEPASVSGSYTIGVPAAGWGDGAYITDLTDVTGEVLIIDDGQAFPSGGCETIINANEISGKVALIDRGGCEFGFKGLQAQNAGAIGVIICNFEDTPLGLGAGAVGSQVNIPTVSLSSSDCQAIRQFAGNGLVVTFKIPNNSGPSQFDSDLDNGVIAHEYGHGISNRLTGGPNNTGCLGGNEQMGEGWSDFMSLVTTVRATDTGEMPRGIGNYVDGLPTTGGGIRHYPYTTDMTINPLTYSRIPGESVPHGVGAAWCTIIWDMYWALTDKYGWDEDLYTGTGGNNIAIRLVFEGMKNQACSPGFVDGRDAILAADVELYNGENQCLIWETFARRGVGLNADQGSSATIGDETESFEVPCECRNKLTISKSVTDFIEAGDNIDVTIVVSNCKVDPVSSVQVKDALPPGTQFVAGSSNVAASVQGNAVVFDLGAMPFGSEETITYKLSTDPNNFSKKLWIDEIADQTVEDNWDIGFLGAAPNGIWVVTDQFGGHTGNYSWYMENIETESRVYIQQFPDDGFTVTGDRPVLRFWHMFNTQPAFDGGVVDIKNVNDEVWQQVPDRMIRNGYTGIINYGTFVVPNLQGYSGFSGDDFIPTYVDLSDWAGQTIHVRFRFGTNESTGVTNGGWMIDDIEYQDMLSYNSQACVTTAQGDNVCVIAPEEGTIVESQLVNSTTEKLKDVTITTFPNPVDNLLNIALDSERPQELQLSLITVDGKVVSGKTVNAYGNQFVKVDVSSFPAGFYFLKITSNKGSAVQKVIIE